MAIRIVLGLAMLGIVAAQTPEKAMKMGSKEVLLTPSDLKWAPAPAATGMPSAVQMTVLSGDPFKAGYFSVRLNIPDGGIVAAHWHPTDEHITVLQGTFAAGMGDKFDAAGLHDFPTGSYVVMPKHMHHFATAKGETIVQVDAMGPFVLNYVNAEDDPRKKK
jgi:quercetin dioxygenase-like cupin family protein